MSEMKNKFYTSIPPLKSALYREVVAAGYFVRSPDTTRTRWIGGGIMVMVLGAGLALLIVLGLKGDFPFQRFLALPFVALAGIGLFASVMGRSMVAKTPSGALEAAKWRAFRTYLANIKKYTSVETAQEQFSRYIGYAVAFGLEKQWIKSFSGALTSMPTWYYYPHYYGRPYYRGWNPSSGPINQEFGTMGRGGLNDMSQNLTDGLNHMSSGLTSMLNQASGTMSSQPSSSGSGGFSGGGSSGGGHAGGH